MFQINFHRYNLIYKQRLLRYFKKDRQFLGLIFFLFLLIIIIVYIWKCIFWVNRFTITLPLSQVFISGHLFYTTDNDIRQSILSLAPMGTFMTQDVRLIQKQIKSIPWIKKVSVRKQWPNKIKIHIIEYVPVAHWNNSFFLDTNAIIFTIPVERVVFNISPMLFGPEGTEKHVLFAYHSFNEILKYTKLEIKSLSMSIRYSWCITLQNNIQLILSKKNNINELKRFVKFYSVCFHEFMHEHNTSINYIDLRYRSGFSVGKR